MTNFAKDIKPGMPVVCANGTEFATVESLSGESSIRLTPDDDGISHWIPLGWVTGVNGTVQIDRSVTQAQEEWSDSDPAAL